MRRRLIITMLFALSILCGPAVAESFVVLHTNDTHSNIDPDASGRGGILFRKAIIDSVRIAEKNVLLVDAGDVVQGTLYFKYFNGDVEYPLMNMMDYDVRILGNHEFDNGLEELARHWREVRAARLSANYDFRGTSAAGLFRPYEIRRIGNLKVGIFGLNTDPAGLISEANYSGMKFTDIIDTANRTAAELRRKGCDVVICVSHIGYGPEDDRPGDTDVARASRDIDVIIGGHSHTTVDPADPNSVPAVIENAVGRPVVVAQTGKYGKNVGLIRVEAEKGKRAEIRSELIPVTDRFAAESLDERMISYLEPYRAAVDSVNSLPVGYCAVSMDNLRQACTFGNWAGDFAADFGAAVIDSVSVARGTPHYVDLALMNVGGIRQPMPEGVITEGQILSTFPFSNRMIIIDVSGEDLLETLRIVSRKGGEAVSNDVRVVTDPEGNLLQAFVKNQPVDPERRYLVATIDYVAEGNDGMYPMARHRVVWRDTEEVSRRILDYIRTLDAAGMVVEGDPRPRFVVERQR